MIRVPDTLSSEALADWLEASILTSSSSPSRVSEAQILNALGSGGVPEPELALSNLKNRIRARERRLGASYPIKLDSRKFDRKGTWKRFMPYSFLLFVSLNQIFSELTFSGGRATKVGELFEKITETALRAYLGGQTLRMGAPRRSPVPASFPKAVTYASEKIGEECGYGEMEIQSSGDDGLDVMAWLPFGDGRTSQLIILAQCAIGINWASKRDELNARLWQRHIRWDVEPIRVFSVPFEHANGNSWRESSVRAGIVLDRLRIVPLLKQQRISTRIDAQLQNWCLSRTEEIDRLSQ